MLNKIENIFVKQGGEFISSPFDISQKLKLIKAYIFDWDGVFNSGTKGEGISSTYSEADSMGTNILRFGHSLLNQHKLPIIAIITGENNISAKKLVFREHFHHLYFRISNKKTALNHLQDIYKLKDNEIAFFFDDILDFPIAERCGLRFMIKRKASSLLINYAKSNNLVDYLSAQEGGNNAVREIVELILGLNNNFYQIIRERTDYSEVYTNYLSKRNKITPQIFTSKDNKIITTISDNDFSKIKKS